VESRAPSRPRAADQSQSRAIPVDDIEAGYQTLFTYIDIDGKSVNPEPDTRVTAVVVFATWCRPCRIEIGWLGELTRDNSQLRVIGVNYHDEFGFSGDERVRAYRDENAPWLQIVRADRPLFELLGQPRYVPSMYLFDSLGRLLRAYLPPVRMPPGRDELQAYIQTLMSDA
jgi:thiol-disulfide isomerase/thioredoxin